MKTKAEMLSIVTMFVSAFDHQRDAAQALGVSPQYLNDIVRDRRDPGPTVLESLGYRAVTMYEPIQEPLTAVQGEEK